MTSDKLKACPFEPTEEMLDASWRLTGESKEMRPRTHAHYRRHWRAMWEATPSPVDAGDEIERLREALEPFAKAADIRLCGEWRDDEHFSQTDVGFYLTFGDLRRARAVLATKEGTENG